MRSDPRPGEEASLLVRLAEDSDTATVKRAIESTGGTIEEDLQFESLRVTADESDLESLCSLDGIESIETDAVVEFAGDPNADM